MAEINEITGDILDASVKIHKMFGPGMLESVYERLLEVGLLVNFGMGTLKEGFVRVVNSCHPDVSPGGNGIESSVDDLDLTNLCVSAPLREMTSSTCPS